MLVSIHVTATFVILVYPRPLPDPSFEWNVQVGDTFTFAVSVRRHVQDSSEFYELNNTIMSFQTTALPDLSNDWNESEFVNEVLVSMKTSLVLPIIHQNGTEIYSNSSESINNILSQCILPIGGWDVLDYYYPDASEPIDYSFMCNTYFSYISDDAFTIGHVYFLYDSGFGWRAQIEQETGIPQEIHMWRGGMDLYPYNLTLFLQPVETL